MIDLSSIFKAINFVARYQAICENHDDFDNGLRSNNPKSYGEILNRLGYVATYFRKERFHKVEQQEGGYVFTLHLTLKDGLVEPNLYIKKGNELCSPDGRMDFIPNRMGVEFDRDKYNIPSYTSESELEDILREIFSIYEDIKQEIIKGAI